MPESRDRLSRPVDYAAAFASRRSGGIGIFSDEQAAENNLFASPMPRTPVMTPPARRRSALGTAGAGGLSRLSFGTPRTVGRGSGRNMYRSPMGDRENTPSGSIRRGRGRPGSSALPSWYPRAPLRDITAVVRAIERIRARLRESEGQENESPAPADQNAADHPESESGAHAEHDISLVTPTQAVGTKPPPPTNKVPKILLGIADENVGESEFLTPQKKLLNSIDTVEKEVKEELQRLKRTPSAKKAEREKRVRTLMSMR